MSSIEFIKTDETAKLPEKLSDDDYVLFSNQQLSLNPGDVKYVSTGGAFAPPVNAICEIIQLGGVSWTNTSRAIGGGDTREIEARIENKTENTIEINKLDPVAVICSCHNKVPTASVSEEQLIELRQVINTKLNRSPKATIKKVV